MAQTKKRTTKETETPKEPAPAKGSGGTLVEVVGQPLCEEGVHYEKGAQFETTAKRAEALGAAVQVVKK